MAIANVTSFQVFNAHLEPVYSQVARTAEQAIALAKLHGIFNPVVEPYFPKNHSGWKARERYMEQLRQASDTAALKSAQALWVSLNK